MEIVHIELHPTQAKLKWECVLTVLLLGLCSIAFADPAISPKLASMQPRPINVPIVQTPITVTIGWFNHQPANLASNLLVVTPLAGGAPSYFALPVTNRAQVTAPSNSVSIMVAAIGVNGQTAWDLSAITNQVPPPQLATNIYALKLLFSPDLLSWTTQLEIDFTNTLGTNSGFWRTKLEPK